jgi:hypothetical protein
VVATGPYSSYSTSSSAVAVWTLVSRQCVSASSDVMLSLTELHESSNLYIAYISVIITL